MKSNSKAIILVISLVLVVILSGILTLYYLKNSSEILENSVQNMSLSVTNKQWDTAQKQLKEFEQSWSKTRFSWAMLIDHFEIDNIDNSFSKSKKYVESQDIPSSLAELEALKEYIAHIPKRESFSIKNIL